MSAPAGRISAPQLRALQTLFGMYARHSLDTQGVDVRSERLAWASEKVARHIASFTELSADEAQRLIDDLKQALGQQIKRAPRRLRDRVAARAAGTHGRRNFKADVEIMASGEDVEAVDRLRERLGMSREDFQTWLASRKSPLGRRGTGLRTVGDCNRVRWALKSMLRRAG